MGIDLAHVRYVLHWSMSKSLEGFYQESGRAGRDGLPSLSVLYYSREDASKFAFLIRKNGERERQKQKQTQTSKSAEEGTGMEALNKMMEYCTSRGCRRKFLLKHFGEEIDAKKVCRKTCDYCIDPLKASQAYGTKSSISRAVRDVKQQKFRFQSKRKEDGMGFQKDFYEDDVDDDHLNKVSDSGLGIMHNPTMDAGFSTAAGTKLGIRSSKSILSKYETMECGKGSKNGFVNFKARPLSKLKASFQQEEEGKEDWNSTSLFGTKSTSVTIPSHLLAKVHESSASLKTKETKVKSSNEISTAADRARAELEEIKKKREALLAKFAKK
jgi:superfamily II DNA helicase RecQ